MMMPGTPPTTTFPTDAVWTCENPFRGAHASPAWIAGGG
jgi:hypothetical protein